MCDRIGIIRAGEIVETGTLDQMRQLTRTQVVVQTKQALAGIETLAGVHAFKADGQVANKAVFAVDTAQIGAVMAELVKREIVTLQTTPPTLEDLFIRYYNTEGTEGHEK